MRQGQGTKSGPGGLRPGEPCSPTGGSVTSSSSPTGSRSTGWASIWHTRCASSSRFAGGPSSVTRQASRCCSPAHCRLVCCPGYPRTTGACSTASNCWRIRSSTTPGKRQRAGRIHGHRTAGDPVSVRAPTTSGHTGHHAHYCAATAAVKARPRTAPVGLPVVELEIAQTIAVRGDPIAQIRRHKPMRLRTAQRLVEMGEAVEQAVASGRPLTASRSPAFAPVKWTHKWYSTEDAPSSGGP